MAIEERYVKVLKAIRFHKGWSGELFNQPATGYWYMIIFIYTWNLFVPCFGDSTLQNKVFSNQNRGHLGSRYIMSIKRYRQKSEFPHIIFDLHIFQSSWVIKWTCCRQLRRFYNQCFFVSTCSSYTKLWACNRSVHLDMLNIEDNSHTSLRCLWLTLPSMKYTARPKIKGENIMNVYDLHQEIIAMISVQGNSDLHVVYPKHEHLCR